MLLPLLRANTNAPLACTGAGTAVGCHGDNVGGGVPRQPFASCVGQEAFGAHTHAAIALQQGVPRSSKIAGERETCSFQHRAVGGASSSTSLP